MKRSEMERLLRKHGAEFVRPGGRHDVWRIGKETLALPRHRELSIGVEKQLKAAVASVLGERWWER